MWARASRSSAKQLDPHPLYALSMTNMTDTTALPSVMGTLNYTLDNGIAPDYYFYEPDPGTVLNPPGTDPQPMPIHDAWAIKSQLHADKQGFEHHGFDPSFVEFDDDTAVKSVFYAQIVDFVKKHTGAKRVEVFDHTIRKRLPADLKAQTTVQRPAVMLVHSDYTVKSGPQRVHDLLAQEAQELLTRRVAFFNVWKPLYRTVQELPLAMCDASTHAAHDMLVMELKYRERTGEIYVMRHSSAHRWYYFPQMQPDQALLLKTYESATDGRARFIGHTAFEDPNTPADAQKRESIEVRTMAFF